MFLHLPVLFRSVTVPGAGADAIFYKSRLNKKIVLRAIVLRASFDFLGV